MLAIDQSIYSNQQPVFLLLTIYSKAEKEDITINDINSILGEYFGEG